MKNNFSFIDATQYLISEESSIYDAMKVIDYGEERICFVVCKDKKLIKVISDGDIRRALIKNSDVSQKVINTHNRKPIAIHEDQLLEDAEKLLNKRVLVAPVIDKKGIIKGLLRYKDIISKIDIKSYDVAILGLGYVGLTLGLVMADHGFSVTGYDVDNKLIKKLKNKQTPFFEKGIQNYINTHLNLNLRVSSNIEHIRSDIYIITVGTPINKKTKKPEVENILKASEDIAKILKKNDLVILRSTVPIGCTRNTVIPMLEKVSSLKVGEDFSVAFCPERTAEGRALEELRNLPQIVGGFDSKSRELGLRLFGENTHTVIDIGSLEAAEMCKLMDNAYRDTRFAFANQMAMLSEKVGLNVNHLITKINLSYERNTIPYPSPGVGGACLSKDPYILMNNFDEYSLESPLIKAARDINEMAPNDIFIKTKNFMHGVGKKIIDIKIFIIGVAFKGNPETSDVRESTTLWFIDKLKKEKITNIWSYDPIIPSKEIDNLGVKGCSLEEGFRNADAVFFMNNHLSYSNIDLSTLLKEMNTPGYFYDGWNIFRESEVLSCPGINYSGIGVR